MNRPPRAYATGTHASLIHYAVNNSVPRTNALLQTCFAIHCTHIIHSVALTKSK